MRVSFPRSRWIGRQAIPRLSRGFSLVELMVVVTIISLIMALVVPSYKRLQKKARSATIVNDFRVFTAVLQAKAHETGSWPAEKPAGEIPDGITNEDIQLDTWTTPNGIGGQFDWEHNVTHNGHTYTAALALTDTPAHPLLVDTELFQEIDAALDDGNINTGNFIVDGSSGSYCLLFIIEP